MLKGRLLFVSLILWLFACNQPAVSPQESKLFGLASPIQLQNGANLILLADYFPDDIAIDSIGVDAALPIDLDKKSKSIQIEYPSIELPYLMNLTVYAEGIPYSILLKSPTEKQHTFVYVDDQDHEQIGIKGDFNSWNANNLQMRYDSASHHWVGKSFLSPGSYQYKLVIDGIELNDPANNKVIGNGMGGSNSQLIIEGVDPDSIASISTHSIDNADVYISVKRDAKIYAYWQNFRLEVQKSNNLYLIKIPPFAKYEKRSHIRVFSYNDLSVGNDLLIPLEKGKVLVDPLKLNNSDWQSSIMYFMMVDRFFDGNRANNKPVLDPNILPKGNFMGGDLKGITQKIKEGYFRNLGINTIWISPIAQNPEDAWGQFENPDTKFSGYHGYWPISSSKVDHRFGTSEELKELLSTAHANGISVLLDYVANHVHQQHPVYQQHKDWVTPLYLPDGSLNTERWDDQRLTTWFDKFLPTLNLMDQNVTNFMVDSAMFWVREYDFDGYRHDATKHIPENFWRTLSKEIKNESKSKGKYIYQIGETYGSRKLISSYIGSGMLDGQFDFNLYDDALAVFASDKESFTRLSSTLKVSIKTYGSHHLMGNISGNQDKPRFISFADGSLSFDTPWQEYKRIGWTQNIGIKDSNGYDKLAMFNAFNLTIPGIPIIYYGDEIGMPGAGDPDNRRMMKFYDLNSKEVQLKERIAKLTALRIKNMALTYGDFQILESNDSLLVYQRKYFSHIAIVMFNKSKSAVRYIHPSGEYFDLKPGTYQILSKLGDQRETIR